MEEFLKSIGINQTGEFSEDGCYVIDLTETDWGKVSSILERSDKVWLDEESSLTTYDTSTLTYDSEDYIITMLADFESDLYRLTVKAV